MTGHTEKRGGYWIWLARKSREDAAKSRSFGFAENARKQYEFGLWCLQMAREERN